MDYTVTSSKIEKDFNDSVIPALCEFVKIDNLSPFFDPDWNTNGKLDNAAQFCLNWALNQGIKGIKGEIIKDEDKTPLIFIEIDAQGSEKNFLLYGHFDKQPHFTGWAEGLGAITPVIKDGNLYGRGAADDGYALFSSITAIKAIQEQGVKHGRIVITIEGSEESGSPHLIPYITKLKDRIGSPDLMICLDSGAVDYDTLWVTSSLRGVVILDLTVEVLQEGVHSGSGTGLAPDSFTIIRSILDRVEDSKAAKVVDDFHVQIPEIRVQDAYKLAELTHDKIVHDHVKLLPGVQPLGSNIAELILNNTWRPTLCITGAHGFPEASVAGNVLRPSTTVRISMRLPPTYDAVIAAAKLEEIITKDPPYNCKISVSGRHPGSGWAAKEFSQKLHNSLENTSKTLWGKSYFSFGEGGSIPFIGQLASSFPSCEILVIGVLGPNSNAHTCNEALNINYCKGITSTLAHTIGDYSQ